MVPQEVGMPRNKITSVKHVIDSEGQLTGGAVSITEIAKVVTARSATFNPLESVIGESIYGIFLSIFIIGATGAPLNGSINWFIGKSRSGQSSVTNFPDPGNTGTSNVRNQIFHEEKGLAGSGDGTAMAFKGVIKVPKGFQRMREGDSMFIKINSQDGTNDAQFCIKAIYKSFS